MPSPLDPMRKRAGYETLSPGPIWQRRHARTAELATPEPTALRESARNIHEGEVCLPSERATLVTTRWLLRARYSTRDTPGSLRTRNASAKQTGSTMAETNAVLAMAVMSIERNR